MLRLGVRTLNACWHDNQEVQGSIPAQCNWVFFLHGLPNPKPWGILGKGISGGFTPGPGIPLMSKNRWIYLWGPGASPRTKVEGAVPSGRNGTRICGDTDESICIDSEWLWSLYGSDRLPGLIVYGSIAPSGLIGSTLALRTACSHAVILTGR